MNTDDLFKRQEEFQREAYWVLEELDLLSILSFYGKPTIVGSLATGLMTWKDIDIEITEGIDEEKYWQVVKKLFHTPKYKFLSVVDFRKSVNPNSAKGLYLSLSDYYLRGEGSWKIDIWFLNPRKPGEENFHKWLQENLKEEHRLPILRIKEQIASTTKYKHEIFSIDIYKAVIEDSAKSLEDFKKYLTKTKRTLD